MDDLAPSPMQRISDGVGQTLEQNFTVRKKAVKKVQPGSAKKEPPEPDVAPEIDPEPDHQVDLLA
jgi:hypothetical protein